MSQRAGLVRTDDGDRSECLDGGQLSDQGLPLKHPPGAESQSDRRDSRQSFRDNRDGQTQRRHQHHLRVFSSVNAESKDDCDNRNRCNSKRASQLSKFLLQRRRFRADVSQRAGDASQLGGHARRDDDRRAATVRHRRTHPDHIKAVAQRSLLVIHRIDLFLDRVRLAGQRGFLSLKTRRFE